MRYIVSGIPKMATEQQLLFPTSSEEDIRGASVIDSRSLESIYTGWFGSHYNLQSVM